MKIGEVLVEGCIWEVYANLSLDIPVLSEIALGRIGGILNEYWILR